MSKTKEEAREIDVDETLMKILLSYQDMIRIGQALFSIYLGQLAVKEWGYPEGKKLNFEMNEKDLKVRITEVEDIVK